MDGPLHIAVVVLGDLGRSPRMLNHARALAAVGARVELIGYVQTEIDPRVTAHANLRVHGVRPALAGAADTLPHSAFMAYGLYRSIRQGVELLRVLRRLPVLDTLLVQTPPAVPTLMVAMLAARKHGARVIVDWHNFGYALVGLRFGERHPVVRLMRRWERAMGRRADGHLTVSHAMRERLTTWWPERSVHVLRDGPDERFTAAATVGRATATRERLENDLGLSAHTRPAALVVSPTSWTADEDFDLLLEAAQQLDAMLVAEEPAYPDLVILITGSGLMRARYEERMAAMPLHRIHLRTLWLSPADYPACIAAADFGLCLHRSASGVDLPIKVVELLGVGVPVCALDYGPCIREIVEDEAGGRLFANARELAMLMAELLRGFPDDASTLAALRARARSHRPVRWEESWRRTALPLLDRRNEQQT